MVPHGPHRRDGASAKTQAAFVHKLYSMVEDVSIHPLIAWNASGRSFRVSNPTEFSRTVLPQYFKHNNWQSFVRQLNMYGFHKITDVRFASHVNDSSLLSSASSASSASSSSSSPNSHPWEFHHPAFIKGRPDLLSTIKRKQTQSAVTVAALPSSSSPSVTTAVNILTSSTTSPSSPSPANPNLPPQQHPPPFLPAPRSPHQSRYNLAQNPPSRLSPISAPVSLPPDHHSSPHPSSSAPLPLPPPPLPHSHRPPYPNSNPQQWHNTPVVSPSTQPAHLPPDHSPSTSSPLMIRRHITDLEYRLSSLSDSFDHLQHTLLLQRSLTHSAMHTLINAIFEISEHGNLEPTWQRKICHELQATQRSIHEFDENMQRSHYAGEWAPGSRPVSSPLPAMGSTGPASGSNSSSHHINSSRLKPISHPPPSGPHFSEMPHPSVYTSASNSPSSRHYKLANHSVPRRIEECNYQNVDYPPRKDSGSSSSGAPTSLPSISSLLNIDHSTKTPVTAIPADNAIGLVENGGRHSSSSTRHHGYNKTENSDIDDHSSEGTPTGDDYQNGGTARYVYPPPPAPHLEDVKEEKTNDHTVRGRLPPIEEDQQQFTMQVSPPSQQRRRRSSSTSRSRSRSSRSRSHSRSRSRSRSRSCSRSPPLSSRSSVSLSYNDSKNNNNNTVPPAPNQHPQQTSTEEQQEHSSAENAISPRARPSTNGQELEDEIDDDDHVKRRRMEY